MGSRLKGGIALLAFLPAFALAQDAGLLAYGGRVVPPMTSPVLPGDWEKPASEAPKRQWDRALPFFAQNVIDKGADLPNPYYVGVSLYYGHEQRILSSLQVGFNGAPLQQLDFVQFPKSTIDNQSPQLQIGAWVLPFMNVYGILGQTSGGGNIDIAIAGSGLAQFLAGPNACTVGALPICQRTITGTAHANYHGNTYGVGVTFAGAYENIFFAAPIAYVTSDLTISDTLGRTWNIAPRIGWNQHLESGGVLTWYGGGTYLKSDMNITGTFSFDTSGNPGLPNTTTMQYSIHVEPKDRWNYLAGVNWTIDRHWGVVSEIGFGNSRSDAIVTGFFRF
jgi:hypothetical protein